MAFIQKETTHDCYSNIIESSTSVINTAEKMLKNKREELDDTVIIDDIINYWIKPPIIKKTEDEIKQCIKCLIPSKRYVIQTATGNDTEKYGLLIY